jgi:hypothetical protein
MTPMQDRGHRCEGRMNGLVVHLRMGDEADFPALADRQDTALAQRPHAGRLAAQNGRPT